MLKKFSQKLGITEVLKYKIHLDRVEFIERLSKLVDKRTNNGYPSLSDIFSPTSIMFKGKINNDTFELRRKYRMSDVQVMAVATGNFIGDDKDLRIEIEIKAFPKYSALVYIPFVIIYLVLAYTIINSSDDISTWVILFFILHFLLLVTAIIVTGRLSVKRLKNEIKNALQFCQESE